MPQPKFEDLSGKALNLNIIAGGTDNNGSCGSAEYSLLRAQRVSFQQINSDTNDSVTQMKSSQSKNV